jgi:hypothetical protein
VYLVGVRRIEFRFIYCQEKHYKIIIIIIIIIITIIIIIIKVKPLVL